MNLSRYRRWGDTGDTEGEGVMVARVFGVVGLYTIAMLLILI